MMVGGAGPTFPAAWRLSIISSLCLASRMLQFKAQGTDLRTGLPIGPHEFSKEDERISSLTALAGK